MYILKDDKTHDKTYYYALINNKAQIVTDRSKAYIFNKIKSAQNALCSNLSREIKSTYSFKVVPYTTPISKDGNITYQYDLNIPEPPVLNKTKEQNNFVKKNVYDNLQDMLLNIQKNIDDLKKYKDVVNSELSHCDKEVNDIQHFIEFKKLSASDGYNIYRELHNILNKRRELKNFLKIIDDFNAQSINVQRFMLNERVQYYKENQQYNPRTNEFTYLFN